MTYSAASLNRVYVGNIPRVLSSQDVRELFAVFGDVASIDLQTDQATKLNEGHATLSFVKSEDATRAQLNAGWLNICGQKLTVVLAADQAARAQCSAAAAAAAAVAAPAPGAPALTPSPQGAAGPLVSPCVLLRNMFGREEFVVEEQIEIIASHFLTLKNTRHTEHRNQDSLTTSRRTSAMKQASTARSSISLLTVTVSFVISSFSEHLPLFLFTHFVFPCFCAFSTWTKTGHGVHLVRQR